MLYLFSVSDCCVWTIYRIWLHFQFKYITTTYSPPKVLRMLFMFVYVCICASHTYLYVDNIVCETKIMKVQQCLLQLFNCTHTLVSIMIRVAMRRLFWYIEQLLVGNGELISHTTQSADTRFVEGVTGGKRNQTHQCMRSLTIRIYVRWLFGVDDVRACACECETRSISIKFNCVKCPEFCFVVGIQRYCIIDILSFCHSAYSECHWTERHKFLMTSNLYANFIHENKILFVFIAYSPHWRGVKSTL